MIGRGLLALAAERLDVTPWPVEVLEAVRVVVDEVDHASGCSMCHSGMQVDEVNLMLAAFTSGDTGAGMDDPGIRMHRPRGRAAAARTTVRSEMELTARPSSVSGMGGEPRP